MNGGVKHAPYWGRFELPEGSRGRWQIGALHLWVYNPAHEWRVDYKHDADPYTDQWSVEVPTEDVAPPDAMGQRFGTHRSDMPLLIQPMLADRMVVARPEEPFVVLPGEEVSVYVSTPAWFALRAEGSAEAFVELPTYRPSDTWIGSPIYGELAYATRTRASLRFDEQRIRPGRAVTMVRLRNQDSTRLSVERIALPMPRMSLHSDVHGHLWTQGVTMERESETVHTRFERSVPPEAGAVEPVCAPRHPTERNVLVRAFNAVFG